MAICLLTKAIKDDVTVTRGEICSRAVDVLFVHEPHLENTGPEGLSWKWTHDTEVWHSRWYWQRVQQRVVGDNTEHQLVETRVDREMRWYD
jgi:hypothetical protein